MNFIIDNIVWILIALISGVMLFLPALQRGGHRISIVQAVQWINAGKLLLLDVRSTEEFRSGHLQNARQIALEDLPNRLNDINKFKAKNVIVICETGARAAKACSQLRAAGFEQAFALDGGIAAWKDQGMPIIKD